MYTTMQSFFSKQLNNKVAFVTGSSFGIGRGIALELAKRGATVIVTGRREAEIENTVQQIKALGGQAVGRPMDITKKEEIDAFFRDFVAPMGLDIFCNNAGITVKKDFLDNTQEELERICQTNLMGAVYCIQNAARLMAEQKRGGSIVVVTSCNAMAPLPNQAFYSATKCALEGLVRAIAWELREDRIRVNCVAPGAVESGMTPVSEETEAFARRMVPVPRIGKPEDIGKAVAFLASEDASYVTGTSLLVDGGLILRAQSGYYL